MEQRKRLGEILVEENIISLITVERVVEISKNLNKRFGTVLEEMGLVTAEELANALARQYNCRTIFNFSINSFPKQVLDIIPAEVALQNHLFPLKVEKDVLALAMADPTNTRIVENLAKNNNLRIALFVATSKEINIAICRHYLGMNVVEPIIKTVLVVDDDMMALAGFREILSKEYMVCTATNGMEAYKEALSKKPHVILTDKEMPKLDGYGLFDALKNIPETKAIPLILVSDVIDSDIESTAFKKGFFDFIAKPAKPLTLLTRVKRAFEFYEKEHYLFMR